MQAEGDIGQYYRDYRSTLFAVAYRMLGTASDAEDTVQDAFLAMQQRTGEDELQSPKAYLLRTVTNRCLNVLKSARKTRETYIGPWLPEPLADPAEYDPAEAAVRKETVSYAFLVLLQRLSPVERAVFVLRESMGYGYDEVARLLGKTEANCRKIYSRVKSKIRTEAPGPPPAEGAVAALADAFIRATRTGDFAAFVGALREDAVLVSDGGGKVRAALNPIAGRGRVQAFLEGLSAKGSLAGDYRVIRLDGESAIVYMREGKPLRVYCFAWDDSGSIRAIYMIANPDKLLRVPSLIER